jgi:hypothetical protein
MCIATCLVSSESGSEGDGWSILAKPIVSMNPSKKSLKHCLWDIAYDYYSCVPRGMAELYPLFLFKYLSSFGSFPSRY